MRPLNVVRAIAPLDRAIVTIAAAAAKSGARRRRVTAARQRGLRAAVLRIHQGVRQEQSSSFI